MKFLVLLLAVFNFSTAFAQSDVKREIRDLLREIDYTVSTGRYSYQELERTRDSLRETLEALYGEMPTEQLACFKQGNGRFYPTNVETQKVVGSDTYSAGHETLQECRETLPDGRSPLFCRKYTNARYYPTNPVDGVVIGSDSYSAGHEVFGDCRRTLPLRRQKLACFKLGNGRYYPVNAKTGVVVGSDSYSAGYDVFEKCVESLPPSAF